MEPNELRIGNYIYDDKNVIVKVERIESTEFNNWNGSGDPPVLFSINGNMRQSDVINPIPLTEEILLKCGFKPDGDEFTIEIDNGWKLVWSWRQVRLKFRELDCEISFREYKCIHQIQNLYFELTGKELEGKLC